MTTEQINTSFGKGKQELHKFIVARAKQKGLPVANIIHEAVMCLMQVLDEYGEDYQNMLTGQSVMSEIREIRHLLENGSFQVVTRDEVEPLDGSIKLGEGILK